MKRIVLAVLLAAAPAFADRSDRYDRHDDQGSEGQGDWSGGWDDEQYDWAQSDGSEGGWDAWDEPAPPPADDGYAEGSGPTLDDFRNDSELSWNGDWIDTPEYGRVWRPTHVSDEWQPYLYGRWVWTRAGWAWASDEPFGWAVYHYGRWAWSPSMGWMWLPGRVWAPAWVAWRWTDGYAAWCPLGPRPVIVDRPALWVVVPSRHFLEPVRHHVVPRTQRPSLPLPARPGPRAGPPVRVVEQVVGRTVRPLAIGKAGTPSSARAGSSSIDFYRPRAGPVATPPRVVAPSQGGPRAVQPSQGQPPRAVAPSWNQPPRSTQQGPRPTTPKVQPPGARPAPAAPPPQAAGQGARVVAPRVAPKQPEQGKPQAPHVVAPRSSSEQPQPKER